MKIEGEKSQKPKIIVDIGAGSYPLGFHIPDLENLKNKLYIAIDLNKETLLENKKIIKLFAKPKDYLHILAKGEQVPIKDSSADKLFLANVLGDPRISRSVKINILGEIHRILKNQGEFIIFESYTPSIAYQNLLNVPYDVDILFPKRSIKELFIQFIENFGFKYKKERDLTQDLKKQFSDNFYIVFTKEKDKE